jgi:hypothetical protein
VARCGGEIGEREVERPGSSMPISEFVRRRRVARSRLRASARSLDLATVDKLAAKLSQGRSRPRDRGARGELRHARPRRTAGPPSRAAPRAAPPRAWIGAERCRRPERSDPWSARPFVESRAPEIAEVEPRPRR